jgi:hypothetical protein
LAAEELTLRKKEEVLTFPATVLSFIKKIARPLDTEEKKQVVLRYLRVYRWLLLALMVILLGLAVIALRSLLRPS